MIYQSAPANALAPLPASPAADAQPLSVAVPRPPRVDAHAVSALHQPGRRESDLSRLTLLDTLDLPTTNLLTYKLRGLLRLPEPLAIWGDGTLAHAAKLGNAEAVQLYMLFVGRDAGVPEGIQQRLLCGRTRFDEGMSLLHQAADGFGGEKTLTREQHHAVGIYLGSLLALPMLERFKLEVIGELNRSECSGEQTSARLALLRGHLGIATELMGAILDARSTREERAARLDALGVTPDELLAALRVSGNFPGSLMRLQACIARTTEHAEPAPQGSRTARGRRT